MTDQNRFLSVSGYLTDRNAPKFIDGFRDASCKYGVTTPTVDEARAIWWRVKIDRKTLADLEEQHPDKSLSWCAGFYFGCEAAIDAISIKTLGLEVP